jgi:LCP family protein required for cell wall assembly
VTQLESHSPRRSRREAERNRAAYGAGSAAVPEHSLRGSDRVVPRATGRMAPPPVPPGEVTGGRPTVPSRPTPPNGRPPLPPGGGRPLPPGSRPGRAPEDEAQGYEDDPYEAQRQGHRAAPQPGGGYEQPRGYQDPYPGQGYPAEPPQAPRTNTRTYGADELRGRSGRTPRPPQVTQPYAPAAPPPGALPGPPPPARRQGRALPDAPQVAPVGYEAASAPTVPERPRAYQPAPGPQETQAYRPGVQDTQAYQPAAQETQAYQPTPRQAARGERPSLTPDAGRHSRASQYGGRAPRQRASVVPEDPRRGSHATPLGQSFGWVVGWTILGALIPGSGLMAAGMRRLGGFLIGLLVFLGLMFGIVAFVNDPVKLAAGLAVEPQRLLMLAATSAVVAAAWIGLVLLTNSQLRRYARLTGLQQGFTTLVVLGLVAGIVLPTYKVASYAMIQRDLVNSVFGGTDREGPAPDAKAADPWAKIPRVNVLLVGSDAGPTRQGIRPDTLILASINTKSGDTVMFSLPRNLGNVPFAEGTPGAEAFPDGYSCPDGSCLLNAVWLWGEQNKDEFDDPDTAGLQATEDAVEGALGLEVNYYALLNLQGFQDFVDAIGGVRVDVKERLPIGGNSKNRRAEGYIEAGENQKLNGFKALWYARSRWSTDDYDRMRRQRCVIGAAVDQADPVKLALGFPKLARAAKDNMATDIPQDELQSWVELATRIQGAKVRSLPFDNKVVANRADPDYDAIRALVDDALKPPKKKAETTPTPGSSTAPSKEPKPEKQDPENIDPTKAQDVKSVC